MSPRRFRYRTFGFRFASEVIRRRWLAFRSLGFVLRSVGFALRSVGFALTWLVTVGQLHAVDGIVIDAQGDPVAAAEIRLVTLPAPGPGDTSAPNSPEGPNSPEEPSSPQGPSSPEGPALGQPGTEATSAELVATSAELLAITDREGRFHIDPEAIRDPRPWVLEVRRVAGAPGGRIVWEPAESETANSLSIELPIIETVVVLHDNDQHFDFNFLDAFLARVEAYRDEFDDVLLFNAGDVLVRRPERWEIDGVHHHGDKQWYRQQSLAIIDKMNRVGFDAMTLGNHELAYVDGHTREALERARFPLLATNVEIATDRLPAVSRQLTFRTSRLRAIAVIGMTLGSADGVRIADRNRVAEGYASLRDSHDVVVAVNHIGYRADREFAERFPYLDLIIGGHSHTLLEEAELVGNVLVAQAGGSPHQASSTRPKPLGIVTLTFRDGVLADRAGRVIEFSAETSATERRPGDRLPTGATDAPLP